jgi:hypothetical protein
MEHLAWPRLALADWEPTYLTLHRWTQIVGKVALTRAPYLNHWWHVAFHPNARGLELTMPCAEGNHVTITFDFCAHRLVAQTSHGRTESFVLEPMSVAAFYDRFFDLLGNLDIQAHISPVPVEVKDRTPCNEDQRHASYDRERVEAFHRVLLEVQRVFNIHRGRFLGKSSPVHFFWGAFDLAVTRFSGRPNLTPPPGRVMREAYSHEVISHGFWPGGDWLDFGRIEEPMFYAYAVPPPAGFESAHVVPREAHYSAKLGEYLLPYEVVRTAERPDDVLLAFMESTYRAAAERAGWDVEALDAGSRVEKGEHALRERSASEVFDEHLRLAQEHDIDTDLARNYSDDCVIMMGQGTYHGHDGARALADQLERELPGAHFDYVTKRVDGPVAFLEWKAHGDGRDVQDGADSFVIRDGRIVAQTIHYTVESVGHHP